MLRERCVGKKGLRGRCVPFRFRLSTSSSCVSRLFLASTYPEHTTGACQAFFRGAGESCGAVS